VAAGSCSIGDVVDASDEEEVPLEEEPSEEEGGFEEADSPEEDGFEEDDSPEEGGFEEADSPEEDGFEEDDSSEEDGLEEEEEEAEEEPSDEDNTSEDARMGVADATLALILSMCCTTSENPGGATLGGARGAGGATLGGRSMRPSFRRSIAPHVLQALYRVCEGGTNRGGDAGPVVPISFSGYRSIKGNKAGVIRLRIETLSHVL
jgi:hypothetical protein